MQTTHPPPLPLSNTAFCHTPLHFSHTIQKPGQKTQSGAVKSFISYGWGAGYASRSLLLTDGTVTMKTDSCVDCDDNIKYSTVKYIYRMLQAIGFTTSWMW
jgi:hypothetical protein